MRRKKLIFPIFILLGLVVSVVLSAPPAQEITDTERLAFDARADLELLADRVIGVDQRPVNWTFNFDVDTPTYVNDIWFDNEHLADDIFGEGVRPPDWFGANVRTVDFLARNVRHDIERSADEFLGPFTRPVEWRGAALLYSCSRSTQNMVFMLGEFYDTQVTTPEDAFDYCGTLTNEIDDRFVNLQYSDPAAAATLPDLILAVRGDLERLADERLGLNNRPVDWTNNRDISSPTLAGDTFIDLELLASELLGDERPLGWIGALSNSGGLIFRNLRHDLELLADLAMGFNIRPRGWQGLEPLARCQPILQDIVFAVRANFEFSQTVIVQPGLCEQAAEAANFFVENIPPEEAQIDILEGESRFLIESQWAFSYMDVAATQYMGIMPGGTRMRAWYRNYGESTMMFVSGTDFALWVDRRWTTLSQNIFDSLPTRAGIAPLTFCDADWCAGPGPTPTPTGFGAVEAVLFFGTQPAPPPQEEILNKTQVNWNHIRVTYVADNVAAGTAQVALEICVEPTQITCETVTSIFDNNIGASKAVISQLNGINVFEMPYGYSSNLVVQGPTLVSPDIWISDPTIR